MSFTSTEQHHDDTPAADADASHNIDPLHGVNIPPKQPTAHMLLPLQSNLQYFIHRNDTAHQESNTLLTILFRANLTTLGIPEDNKIVETIQNGELTDEPDEADSLPPFFSPTRRNRDDSESLPEPHLQRTRQKQWCVSDMLSQMLLVIFA